MDIRTIIPAGTFSSLYDAFYRNFLIGLAVTDAAGRFVHTREGTKVSFCSNEDSTGLCPVCIEENIFAINESLRFGNTYIMNSHTGLLFFAVPVMVNQSVIGGIVSSRILPMELYTIITDEKNTNDYISDEHIIRNVKSIPVIEAGTVRIASENLFSLSVAHNLVNETFLAARRASNEQEANIAEAIATTKVHSENYHLLYLYKEKDLIERIKANDRHGAVRILNDILVGIFGVSNTPIDVIKVRLMELIVIISRAAVEAGVKSETLLGLNYSYFRDIAKLDDAVGLTHWIVRVLENYISEVGAHGETTRDGRIARALRYVEEHHTSRITLDEVSSAVGLSPSHFAHEFKKEVGVSFITYVNNVKLTRAAGMLTSTANSVVEIAYDLGYSDQSYFIKQFKAKYKMTPLAYRNHYQRPARKKTI
ncbi:MAG: helix-turn-helix domain-containing protein [Spirochaetota bacterium]